MKEREKHILQLEARLREAETSINEVKTECSNVAESLNYAQMKQLKTDRTKENITKLYRLRAQYNTIAEYRTKGTIIRSTIRWHENGEKNTVYFLNMEKRQHCK